MSITLELPPDIEQILREEWAGSLPRKVLEAVAVEAYRDKKIGGAQVRRLLGFEDRWETFEFLSARGVYPNYDLEEFEEDMKTLERLELKPRP
ncbi:MAG: UPF0175 family protein [Armatimonadetes bacterium]|nr:UPF0175 family protein [Armatimonadota bacterium]